MARSGVGRRVGNFLGIAISLLAMLAFARCSSSGGVTEGEAAGGSGPGAGGQAGGGQGGQSGSGGAGQGGTSPASCSGCRSDQLCVNGACTDLPSQCPCPIESYCDLS